MKTSGDDKKKLELLARKAAKFIYDQTQGDISFIRIQTYQEFQLCQNSAPGNEAGNADDKILQWCLYLKQNLNSLVVLVSNDIVFCTKTAASGVLAYVKENFVDQLSTLMSNQLSRPSRVEPVIVSDNARPVNRNESVHKELDREAHFVKQIEECLTTPLGKVFVGAQKSVHFSILCFQIFWFIFNTFSINVTAIVLRDEESLRRHVGKDCIVQATMEAGKKNTTSL